MVITNSSGDVVKEYDYYPFGKISEETGSLANTHKLTGQEWDDGYDTYHFWARGYDPEIGRWTGVDPIIYPGQSPYSYCFNNPVNYIDPSGMAAGSGGGGFNDPGWQGWQGKPFPLITSGMWDESRGGQTYCIDGVEVPAYMALILIRSNAVDWDKSWVGSRVPGHWERRDLPGGNAGEVIEYAQGVRCEFTPGEPWGDFSIPPIEVVAYYEWAWVPDDNGLSGELTPEERVIVNEVAKKMINQDRMLRIGDIVVSRYFSIAINAADAYVISLTSFETDLYGLPEFIYETLKRQYIETERAMIKWYISYLKFYTF